MKLALINIRPGHIKDGFLYKQDFNIYSFVYSIDLRINTKDGQINLFRENNSLNFEIKTGEADQTYLIRQYGSESCCSNDAKGKKILEFNSL